MNRLPMWPLLLALVAGGGVGLAQGQDRSPVFINGALAVPGAPTDGETVPSKYSSRNAASDRLPIAAFRLKSLTDDQRREIYERLTGGRQPLALSPGQAEAPHAMVGAEIPADVALRDFTPMPAPLAASFPELRGTVFMRSEGKVLLIDPSNRIVIGVLPGR